MADVPPIDLIVLPARGRIDLAGFRRWLLKSGGESDRSRRVLRRATVDPADVRGVRPYRPGDSRRSIHWRTTARAGELMVREYDAAPSAALVLALDPWLPDDPNDTQRANLEAALSLTATLAAAYCEEERNVFAMVLPDRVVARQARATTQSMLEPLADVKGTTDATLPSLAPLPAAAVRVLVSSRQHSPLAAALARSSGRRFLNVDAAEAPPWYLPPEGVAG